MSTLKSSAEHLTLNADGSGNDIKFQSNATEVAAIDQSGNLTLSGTVDGVDIQTLNTTAGAALPKAGGTMTGILAGFTSTGIDDNATSNAITIDSSENVGIGTVSPAVPLHVDASGGGLIRVTRSSSTSNYIQLEHDGTNGKLYSTTDTLIEAVSDIIHKTTTTNSTAGHHIFKSYNTEIMRIDGGNNRVGIGTTDPQKYLHMQHGSTNAFSASNDSWHSTIIHNNAAAATNTAGIAFVVSGSAYHGNAGTGIAAVKNGTNSDYGADLVFITRPQSAAALERMRISSAGIVTMPLQPAFSAGGGAHQNITGIFTVEFNYTTANIGSHYNTSNYRFTAPVIGTYTFSYGWMAHQDEAQRSALYVNGSRVGDTKYSLGVSYANTNHSVSVTLAASDYVEVKNNVNGGSTEGYVHSNYRYFTGHLIG